MNTKNEIDLSGKLIIKVQLGDDIRRIPIHNEAITYDELVLMMQRVFRGKLSAKDEVLIKYKDEDGDLISIFDSSDLSFAIQCSRILKLQLLLNTNRGNGSTSNADISLIKKQLKDIRSQVDGLLDILENVPSNQGDSSQSIPRAQAQTEQKQPERKDTPNLNKVNSSEFDPLQDRPSSNKNGHDDKSSLDKQPTSAPSPATNENSGSRPQSVSGMSQPVSSMSQPVSSMSQQPQSTQAQMQAQQMSDYYGRSAASATYPQMFVPGSYQGVPQHPSYPRYPGYSPQVSVDSSQSVPTSGGFQTPGTPQGGMQYATGQQYQQQFQPSQNPYSAKTFQPSPQHYIPPRQ